MRTRSARPNWGFLSYRGPVDNAQEHGGVPDGDLLQDADLEREPMKEPAKRWRNKWLSNYSGVTWNYVTKKEEAQKKGDVFWSSRDFPSKEIAEQRALDMLALPANRDNPFTYLGAFPVADQ